MLLLRTHLFSVPRAVAPSRKTHHHTFLSSYKSINPGTVIDPLVPTRSAPADMSTHGMLPDGGGGSSSAAPLMPAFNPGESVFAVDTSKLNQALSWIMHNTKKHSVDIDEVKRDTAGLLAFQRQASVAPPPAAAPASEDLRQEFESRFQGIQKDHVALNEALQQRMQELDAVKLTLKNLSENPPPTPPRPSTNTEPSTPKPPPTPKECQDFVRLPQFTDVINELRSDLRKHSRFMVKVSERTGLQAAAAQFERMVIRSKLKQFESKSSASADAASGQTPDASNTDMAAYVRGITRGSKRRVSVGGDADSGASRSHPATPGLTGARSDVEQLQEVEELVKVDVPGELQLQSDAEEDGAALDSRYLSAISQGLTPDEIAAAAAADQDAFSSRACSRDASTSRGGSRHGRVSQVLSLHDDASDAMSQTESAGGSIGDGLGGHFNHRMYEERLDKLQSRLEAMQQTASDAMDRVAHVESGFTSLQQRLHDVESEQQRHSDVLLTATHGPAAEESPRSQGSDVQIVVTSQVSDPVEAPGTHSAPLPSAASSGALTSISEAPASPAAVLKLVGRSDVSSPSQLVLDSPASSLQSRRASLNLNSRDIAEKAREMFIDRPEERAAKEKKKAEELARRVPLEDFLAVKAEAEATKKALASAEIMLKQLTVRVSALEETSAPKAAITVLEGNTSKRIVGLEGRLRTLSSILSAKADSMTVDAVSASVEANAAGLLQLKDRLESVLQSDGDDKNASDYLVLLTSLNRMKNDIAVTESRLVAELKDIRTTVEHSNSSVRILQSTFAAEKLRKLNTQKPAPHGQNAATGHAEAAASTKRSQSPTITGTQGMVSESGHIITNAVPGTLPSGPSATRPRPRDVEGSISVGYKGGSLSIPENAAALKVNSSWPNGLTQEQVRVATRALLSRSCCHASIYFAQLLLCTSPCSDLADAAKCCCASSLTRPLRRSPPLTPPPQSRPRPWPQLRATLSPTCCTTRHSPNPRARRCLI
jgi:hypothetical protein